MKNEYYLSKITINLVHVKRTLEMSIEPTNKMVCTYTVYIQPKQDNISIKKSKNQKNKVQQNPPKMFKWCKCHIYRSMHKMEVTEKCYHRCRS